MTITELYKKQVRQLSPEDRLRLARWILDDLVENEAQPAPSEPPRRRNLMELHGLGKEVWQGVDIDAYIDELRNEWDQA